MNTIEIYSKCVYGKDLVYIADKKIANIINQLTESKTLSDKHIEALMKLGFNFKEVLQPK